MGAPSTNPEEVSEPDTRIGRFIAQTGRLRLVQLVVSIVGLAGVAQVVDGPFFSSWWFWVGISTAFSVTLLEPHYTPPRSAAANAIGGLAVFFTATTTSIELVWQFYFGLAVVVLAMSLIVVSEPEAPGSAFVRWISARFGRARVFGMSALLLESVRLTSESISDGATLLVSSGVFLALITLDWPQFLVPRERRARFAVFEAAIEPNLLLFSSAKALRPGQRISVARGSRSTEGYVVDSLAHKRGDRYQLVLDGNWRALLGQAGSECTITPLEEGHNIVGFVIEGTTETSARFHPLNAIDHGSAVAIEGGSGPVLFQVTSLELQKDRWDESYGLQARATATQIGALTKNGISLEPWLPRPFQPIEQPSDLEVDLPKTHVLIGHVSGTQIPIGVQTDWTANAGHVAVLGMSGMGKTTAAQLLASAFEKESTLIALDGTAEYRTRLGWTALPKDGWSNRGRWVYEPGGLPAETCKITIETLMTSANKEFASGEPARRVLLIEEAHSFLPEWNFATRTEQEHVHRSARFILQSRKFNLSFIFVSQRTAVISKSALSQCENFLVLRTIDKTSLEFIEGIVGSDFRNAVSSLKRFQALCVGPIFNTESPVIIDLIPPSEIGLPKEKRKRTRS